MSRGVQVVGQTVGFIQTLTDSQMLRKAAQQLVSRLPTLEEFQMVSVMGTPGVGQAID